MNLVDVVCAAGIAKSKREARDLINGNSIAVNGEKVKDINFTVEKKDAFTEELCILKKGKKNWFVCCFK